VEYALDGLGKEPCLVEAWNVWANWVGVRHGLPFSLSLKPRPTNLVYVNAARESMRGNHQPMVTALLTLLSQHP